MRGWIFVGLITGAIFGSAAAIVAWTFAMPLGVTFRVVALAIPLGIALEWVTVRGKGVGFPVAFLAIGGLAFLLYLQVRDVSAGPRFVREAATPEDAATAPGGGGGGGGGRAATGTASGGGAQVVEPGRAESEGYADALAASTTPAVLAIRNPTEQTLRLWILDTGGRSRLGRLRAGRTREVRIRAREPSVVIEVRGSGGGYTMPVGIAPGATLSVELVPPG